MAKAKHTKNTYIDWYKLMLLIRRFEEKSAQMYGQNKIRGFCHLYIGQEAVVAGMASAKQEDDKVITAYRDHGHALAMGISANAVMAELFGRIDGCSKGKGGSMHMFSKEHHFFGGHGIVGGQIPLGAGIALAEQYKGTDNVCFCYMGDGAVRQGALHEAFNMAMLWKLPVVFICENNNYAMGTSVERTTNVVEIYKMACSYEMPAEQIDGMSCEDVHDSMARCAARAREGDGPTFVELKTYRYRGHSMSDPAKYRTKEEVQDYRNVDPIEVVKAKILKSKYLTQKQLDKIEEDIENEVLASVEFADNSRFPDSDELYKDVYVEDYPFIVE
ncbi:MAG: pyruvate dehydrogenase (acetyl-transferring) E1 component subunit alpha [Bacteroidia bacterium]|nr:pyruvate dehydrogenase (acetyl-transferring) E1 component subunit alpha [Bacteroidia bacterium]NNJ56561.1 pyruvate dehydrogenase (acetyl-transferring) E1 component subunit alpha [Bacteroidia bacterium]